MSAFTLSHYPHDWYWIVAGDETQVYSSALRTFVATRDAAYQGWLKAGGLPTTTDSKQALDDVLIAQYPAGLDDGGVSYARSARMERLAQDIETEGSDLALVVAVVLAALEARADHRITKADVAAKLREKGTGIAHVR